MSQITIESVRVENALEKNSRVGNLEVYVTLDIPDTEVNRYLWARLEDRKGNEADAIFPLPIENEMSFCMRVTDPQLWNAESASAYKIIIEIKNDEEQVLFSEEHWTAFYHWEIMDRDVCLNGKRILFRKRALPADLKQIDEIDGYLRNMKREFCNSLLIRSEQKSQELEERCLEYGIYLITPGEHLEYGRICAELEQNPEGDQFEQNPDFSIQVVKDGALIENRSTFINTCEYQLIFEIKRQGNTVQKGKLHVDIPAGESKYLNLPYMKLHDFGEFEYHVALGLEKGYGWEEEGYEVAYGETKISNFFI